MMLAMLDGLREVCRQVLLPSGSLKKYTQFVMGLLLVAAMLNPLLGLTRGLAPEIKASVFTDMQRLLADDGQTEQIVAAGSNLASGARAQAAQELAAGLEKQIASLVGLADGVEACTVEVNLDADLLYEAAEADSWHNWGQVIIVLTVEEARQGKRWQIFMILRRRRCRFQWQALAASYQRPNRQSEVMLCDGDLAEIRPAG